MSGEGVILVLPSKNSEIKASGAGRERGRERGREEGKEGGRGRERLIICYVRRGGAT